jgi:hypothetical protein
MKRIVTVVAAVIVPLKELTIPRTKKEIPFTDHSDREYTRQTKRPALAGLSFFQSSLQKAADPSNLQLLHLRHLSSLQASWVHNFTLLYSAYGGQDKTVNRV